MTNPLLPRAQLPGETFTLPSGGIFYTNGELAKDVIDGEITVNPMVTIDELHMKSTDMLFSGKAIELVFKRCMPQIEKPLELLGRDVDFLLTCLKKVTYGDMHTIFNKHDCKNAKDAEYDISLQKIINRSVRIDPTTILHDYTIMLYTEQKVSLIPPRFKHILAIYQASGSDEDEDIEKYHAEVMDTVLALVADVDGITDKKNIREWLTVISPKMIKQINKAIESASDWGSDFTTKVKCKDCDKIVNVETPLNPIAFFL